MADIRVKLVKNRIEEKVVIALRTELNRKLRNASQRVLKRARTLFKNAFLSSDTYISLVSDDLWHEFGIVHPEGRLRVILDFLLNDMSVSVIPLRGKLAAGKIIGGFTLHMLDANFDELLSLDAGFQQTEKGESLHWLNWLLTQGDRIIIREYHFKGVLSPASRTGEGLMLKGSRFKVNPRFAGTKRNNWLTRLIDEIQEPLALIIEEEMTK